MNNYIKRIVLSGLTLAGIVLASGPSFAQFRVSVGYADTVHTSPGVIPSPWLGSPGVTFSGTSAPYDAGAIMIHNPGNQPLTVASVTVDIGTALGINPWVANFPATIPPKGALILTQTAFYNFDTSEIPFASCTNNGFVPVIHVTAGSPAVTKNFADNRKILNTKGADRPPCVPGPGPSEGHQWVAAVPR